MTKKTYKSAFALCSILFSLVALFSCQKDKMYIGGNAGKEIQYAVFCDYVQSSEVKSSSEEGTIVQTFFLTSEDGTLSIPVAVIETDGISCGYCTEKKKIKGSLINGPEGAEGYTGKPIALSDSLKKFVVYAFDTDTQNSIFTEKDTVATYKDSRWLMNKAYYWPQASGIDFYAYANLPEGSSVKLDEANRRQVLAYTVPGNTDDQKDILMGIYSGTGTANGEAEIRFMHPLTAVQFKRDGTTEMTGVTNITMSGVHFKGKATQTLERPTYFSWVLTESRTTTVIQDNDGKPFEVHGDIDGDPFMLIPQSADEGNYVDLSVTVIYNGHNVPLNSRITGMNWRPGKTYTYIIGYEGTLEIEFTIDDIESETVKKNAIVRNIGSKKCYVRTTAVGYITDDEGNIKSSWLNDEGDNKGTFTVLSGTFGSTTGWNSNWVAGTDGFWYYRKPLECSGTDEAAKKTTPLFDQYSITTLASGECFEMVCSAQAVQWDSDKEYVKATWGETAAGILE